MQVDNAVLLSAIEDLPDFIGVSSTLPMLSFFSLIYLHASTGCFQYHQKFVKGSLSWFPLQNEKQTD